MIVQLVPPLAIVQVRAVPTMVKSVEADAADVRVICREPKGDNEMSSEVLCPGSRDTAAEELA